MNANEFVKKYGLELSREIVNKQPKWASNVRVSEIIGTWEYTEKVLPSFSIVELKGLVESHELVNEFFNLEALGFDKAIELAKKQIEELEDNETVEFWHRWDDDLSCTVARMKQAIADVESCMEVNQ